MNLEDEMEAVDMVDKLMTCFRNGVKPHDRDVVRAYELGVNVADLERVFKEVEGETETEEDCDECGGCDRCLYEDCLRDDGGYV